MNAKQELQQDVYEWINEVKKLADKGYELGDRVGSMKIACPSTEAEELKRFSITSHQEGVTLAVGDIITWSDNGSLTNSNDRVNVDIVDNSGTIYDQGVSTQAGSFVLTNVPSGDIEICLQEMIFDSSDTFVELGPDRCCYEFQGGDLDLLKTITFDVDDTGPMTTADFQALFGADYWFSPTNPEYFQILNGQLTALHPANQIQSQSAGCRVDESGKNKFSLCQEITFDSTFAEGQGPGSSLDGKIGAGFGHTGTDGSIVAGGSTNGTGWLLRTAFVDDELAVSAYFENRVSTFGTFAEMIPTGVAWANGATYKVEIIATLNSTGNTDGVIEVLIDNSLVATRTGVRFSLGGVLDVDFLQVQSFHGGASTNLSPAQDTTLAYDNVILSCIT